MMLLEALVETSQIMIASGDGQRVLPCIMAVHAQPVCLLTLYRLGRTQECLDVDSPSWLVRE